VTDKLGHRRAGLRRIGALICDCIDVELKNNWRWARVIFDRRGSSGDRPKTGISKSLAKAAAFVFSATCGFNGVLGQEL